MQFRHSSERVRTMKLNFEKKLSQEQLIKMFSLKKKLFPGTQFVEFELGFSRLLTVEYISGVNKTIVDHQKQHKGICKQNH